MDFWLRPSSKFSTCVRIKSDFSRWRWPPIRDLSAAAGVTSHNANHMKTAETTSEHRRKPRRFNDPPYANVLNLDLEEE